MSRFLPFRSARKEAFVKNQDVTYLGWPLCDPHGSIHSLSTVGLPVGCVEQCSFAADEVPFPKGSQLYVFSDGIYEIPKQDGTFGTYAEFFSSLKEKPTPEEAVERARARMDSDRFTDDVSILSIANR